MTMMMKSGSYSLLYMDCAKFNVDSTSVNPSGFLLPCKWVLPCQFSGLCNAVSTQRFSTACAVSTQRISSADLRRPEEECTVERFTKSKLCLDAHHSPSLIAAQIAFRSGPALSVFLPVPSPSAQRHRNGKCASSSAHCPQRKQNGASPASPPASLISIQTSGS